MSQSALGFSSTMDLSRTSATTSKIFGSQMKLVEFKQIPLRSFKQVIGFKITDYHATFRTYPRDKHSYEEGESSFEIEGLTGGPLLTQELPTTRQKKVVETQKGSDLFSEMKHRFLTFKKEKFLENPENFQNLAKGQAPKFMVIACGDSRVCPSNILGFQPGEAFVIRNVANLVPPFENGPTETNAALEFAVNTLEVENILVIGHSCCGGIRALMSMQDEEQQSGFIKNWVVVGKNAKISTKAAAYNLNFDQQCQHCEKESVNHSLLNLLSYSWIEEKVIRGKLSIHGGYYDFINCSFEKWTLDYQGSSFRDPNGKYSLKNREFWC